MEVIPSLFSSPSNEVISLITQKPPTPSLQNYQSPHHKPFLFVTVLSLIASTGFLQKSPTAEITLSFQFYESSLMSPEETAATYLGFQDEFCYQQHRAAFLH